MKKGKILATALAFALMLALAGAAAGSGAMTVSVNYTPGAAVGDTMDVQIEVSGAANACAVQFALSYDTSVLECVSCDVGPALQGMMSATNPNASDGARLAAASATEVDINGVIATLQFRVLSAGSYDFTLGDAIFADADGDKYSYTLEGADEPDDSSPSTPAPSTPQPPATEAPEEPEQSETTEEPEVPEETEEPESEAEGMFTDVSGHWAESYINEAAGLGLINGIGGGLYSPDSTMTRAQFVTILWRSQGSPEPSGAASFSDLGFDSWWFEDAVAWAEQNGIVNGVGEGRFDPNGHVTREQIATILFRMSGDAAGDGHIYANIYEQAFSDSSSVGSWAEEAVWWAIYHEIWCGTNSADVGLLLSSTQAADRAQIAVMMVRYLDYMEGS